VTRTWVARAVVVAGVLALAGLVLWELVVSGLASPNHPAPVNLYPGVELQNTYVVAAGDTISGIAQRFGVAQRAILSTNHVRDPNRIFVGERLVIPAPFRRKRTERLIRRIATRFGLDPNFALAIAWNESGFQEGVVSKTGAIGVMQIEPETAVQLAADLGRTINLGIARQNVTAGVYYLHYLVGYYGGNERSAAAAYYEGQGNLARHGYLAGTRHYVDLIMDLREQFRDGSRG